MKRKSLRTSFTNAERNLAQLLAILETNAKDNDKLHVLNSQLVDKFSRLDEIQNEISSLLLEENKAKYERDFEAAENYRDRYLELKPKVATFLNKNSRCVLECSSKDNTAKLKLPKYELKKFSGHPKEFLTFWSIFSKIHESDELSEIDKFHEVFPERKICGFVPKIENQYILENLRIINRIKLMLFSNEDEIDLLLGADLIGKLLTGKCFQLNFGLAAIHAKLGWTVVGKETGLGSSNDEIVVDSSVKTVLPLYVNDISLKELWGMDSLGIPVPIENVSKRKLFDEQLKEFHEKSTVLPDDRKKTEGVRFGSQESNGYLLTQYGQYGDFVDDPSAYPNNVKLARVGALKIFLKNIVHV
ncbi:hypothetical protein HNY73_002713 [Argiope bruennichi]|uniref:UVR domain-containing protein n=1 Tax=Argiope bruennichi TaxID=94029 RepID=A0A8T0FUH2_ARGBR|nr:hypothetical protein HNY73_002713 [Argiope bruennichi]